MDHRAIQKVVVIGTGMMGPGIAQCFAAGGRRVTLIGRSEESLARGRRSLGASLQMLQAEGVYSGEEASRIADSVVTSRDLPSAAGQADLVVESIVEDLPTKQKLFAELEGICSPDTIITSNTSGLRITEIAARMERPERTATTHFWMPPHLVPLVEIVKGERTTQETLQLLRTTLAECGKRPVVVRKDMLGQLGARLLAAITREAMYLVQQGVATAEEVDTAVKMGLGLRFPVYGPLEHSDTAGLDLVGAVQGYLFADLCNSTDMLPIMLEKMSAGKLGAKSGEGFYNWRERSPEELKRIRDAFLVARLKDLVNPRPVDRGGADR